MQERPSAPREVTMRRWAPSRTPSHAECAEAVEIDHRHREARCRGGVVRLGLEMRAVEHPDEQAPDDIAAIGGPRSEEHTSELQSLMRISYAVLCLKKKKTRDN